jgi:hypothetical protein
MAANCKRMRAHEQMLINQFVKHLRSHADGRLCIKTLHNDRCKSRSFADVEFDSTAGIRWVVEAKSHKSPDRHNGVHKLLGELLKETGRLDRPPCRYALLIPEKGVPFYSWALQAIDRDKFIAFGQLIPVDGIFVSSTKGIREMTWISLYDAFKAEE